MWQPYIIINEDINTQKSPHMGRLDKCFFFGHLQRNMK